MAVIRAAKLVDARKRAWQAVPSPIRADGLEENLYHAHAMIEDDLDDHFFALHTRHLFATQGKVFDKEGKEVAPEKTSAETKVQGSTGAVASLKPHELL